MFFLSAKNKYSEGSLLTQEWMYLVLNSFYSYTSSSSASCFFINSLFLSLRVTIFYLDSNALYIPTCPEFARPIPDNPSASKFEPGFTFTFITRVS